MCDVACDAYSGLAGAVKQNVICVLGGGAHTKVDAGKAFGTELGPVFLFYISRDWAAENAQMRHVRFAAGEQLKRCFCGGCGWCEVMSKIERLDCESPVAEREARVGKHARNGGFHCLPEAFGAAILLLAIWC